MRLKDSALSKTRKRPDASSKKGATAYNAAVPRTAGAQSVTLHIPTTPQRPESVPRGGRVIAYEVAKFERPRN